MLEFMVEVASPIAEMDIDAAYKDMIYVLSIKRVLLLPFSSRSSPSPKSEAAIHTVSVKLFEDQFHSKPGITVTL